MRLPPEPLLRAAQRWLDLLPSSGGIPRARALLTSHPAYDDLTPTQYANALAWLSSVGILEGASTHGSPALRIIGAIFENAAPAWVRDADLLVRGPDELPSDIVSAGSALGLTEDEIFAQLTSSWGKVDTAARERVGAAGEEALVRGLRSCSHAKVERVSEWSDGFGYDIAVSAPAFAAHLEVKTTTRRNRFTAFLSRHEYEVSRRDTVWALVVVRLSDDLSVDAVGTVDRQWLSSQVPADRGVSAQWASCKLEIPDDAVEGGTPMLAPVLHSPMPTWSQPRANP